MENYDDIRNINPEYFDLLVQWQQVAFILIFVPIALGVLIYLFYKIRTASLKSLKEKFDHISSVEIKRYFLVQVMFAIGLFFFINFLEFKTVAFDPIWFAIRMFIGLALAILYGYVARLLLKYYWPGVMHKRLRKLRYTPRVNPANGNKMKLLSEEEEDAYLDEGKQAEENVFSVDYDVWIDEATGHTIIEKYAGHLTALECDRCGFQTLKLDKEEIVKPATAHEDGELFKEFKCTYCNRIKRKTVVLSHTMKQDVRVGRLVDDPLDNVKRVITVKVDIFSNEGDHLTFEFQNIKQAQKFLDEFEFEKVND